MAKANPASRSASVFVGRRDSVDAPIAKRPESGAMKEPGTFSLHQSFGGARPFVEVQDELIAAGHDVVIDDAGFGALFLRAEDCEGLLTSRRFGAVALPVLYLSGVFDGPLYDLWSVLMGSLDGDDHRRIRSVVASFFAPSGVERYRSAVEGTAAELALALPDDAAFDLWEAYALPLAARTACHTVGIPAADVPTVTIWALDLVQAFGVLPPDARARAEVAATEFTSYLDGLLASKRKTAEDDIASAVVGEPGQRLTYDEQRGLVANVTFGGLDAMAKVVTTGVFHLLTFGRWPELAEDPELAGSATDELLRFCPPTGALARAVTEPTECAGVELKPGQVALPSLRAACRDPTLFERPDEVDLHRPAGRQFAFGAGPHYCLGAHLAKLVIATALSALARRFPCLRLAGCEHEVAWGGSPFYGVEKLLLRHSP
jgi:cytochrome P450